jgi:hypothetical protein
MYCQIDLHQPEKAIYAWEKEKYLIPLDSLSQYQKLVISVNLFNSYFLLNNYHAALRYMNKIINTETDIKLDVQKWIRLLLLVVHYELKNYKLLPYLCKSAGRWLLKNNALNELDKKIIDFFEKEITKAKDSSERTETFKKHREKIIPLCTNFNPADSKRYFEYISWLESKIQNRPFAEIVKEKAGKNTVI